MRADEHDQAAHDPALRSAALGDWLRMMLVGTILLIVGGAWLYVSLNESDCDRRGGLTATGQCADPKR